MVYMDCIYLFIYLDGLYREARRQQGVYRGVCSLYIIYATLVRGSNQAVDGGGGRWLLEPGA